LVHFKERAGKKTIPDSNSPWRLYASKIGQIPMLPSLSALVMEASHNFALGYHPILILLAGCASPLQIKLVSAAANFGFQLGPRTIAMDFSRCG
jgi:hypothetical protein